MSMGKRAAVYLGPEIRQALRLKAAATDGTISNMVNAAPKQSLAEDAIDLGAFRERRAESRIGFETFVKALHRRGKL